ncbi:N-acetyltransferase [Clostridium sp. CF012]|uniref:GNAT family N-acetyltransferase n=1 Tax=Clostridium sp. CF012 TaxID=2843319 RepID=UPI001C0D0549|nr:GNAT family N-acetyltransferase [Clostridium sp. CF012]MBU3144378.1 GNAT family N-acetyltransferase [Clostridium sp. CF012]
MNIILVEVNIDNWQECVSLKVAENQKKFVTSNSFSLAQSKYEPECTPMCIYNDETMVGFVMLAEEKDDEKFWICRFMIDEKFQGKGYGKASLAKIMDYIATNYDYDEVYLSEVPENARAKGLYKRFGFEFTGEIEDEEEVMIFKIKSISGLFS